MNVSKDTISEWDDLSAVAKSFQDNGFSDITATNGHADVSLKRSGRTLLRIIKTLEPFNTKFSEISGQIRYLLLFNDSDFMFVRQDMTKSGAFRYLKFKFSKANPQNSTIQKFRSLAFDHIHEFDNLFDMKEIVKRFYDQYKKHFERLAGSIGGGGTKQEDRIHYAQILMYRIIFLYFIQAKKFLGGDEYFLRTNLQKYIDTGRSFYDDFLKTIFFNVLNTPASDRIADEYGDIPFLNGGLFRKHRIEEDNPDIKIDNAAFVDLLEFLSEWIWYVDETADAGGELAINPEILGNIFEKTITDQKGKGAYYTPANVTKYITESTIIPYCIERINSKYGTNYSEIMDVEDRHVEELYFVIRDITVLDNACGSGEFILSASKLLFDLYNTTWNKIRGRNTKRIRTEQDVISRCTSQEHYFKRRIISFNLFGVDLEENAVDICKLRLWLSLVSEMSRDNVEPLPNIDYNVMAGNSIIGYIRMPDTEQRMLDDQGSQSELIREIDALKRRFKSEKNPEKSKELAAQIDSRTCEIDRRLSRMRNAELCPKDSFDKVESMNPFHWRLHFGNIMTETGGFDCIVGNPPYVMHRELDYPIEFLDTFSAGNSYAYFFETGLSLLKPGGRLGYIVPVSSISTGKMSSLREYLIETCQELRISNYDDRPGKLFNGLNDCRSSIILCRKSHKESDVECDIYTTGYKRWYTENVSDLFDNIQYIWNPHHSNKYITKIGDEIENSIMTKISRFDKMKKLLSPSKCKNMIIYHNAPRYWTRGMNFMPYFKAEGKSKSTHNKILYIKDKKMVPVIIAILNSSLFYWYFIKTSNCRDLTSFVIEDFHLESNLNDDMVADIKDVVKRLMMDYRKNAVRSKETRETGSVVQDKFYPKKSKNIIDEIDDILADYYKLTRHEAEYIKNFDSKFRMCEDS